VPAIAIAPARLRAAVPAYFGLSPDGRQSLEGQTRRSASWRVLKNRDFRCYFTGSVVSDLGTWFQNTAQVLLAYKLSHSALLLGMVTGAQYSSPLLLSAWAGVMTHKRGARRILFWTQVAAAACAALMAGLVFAGPINCWWLGAGAVASGLAFTFTLPARNVMIRRLVSRGDEEPAFGMDSVSYNLGRAVAPPLSVLLVTAFGFGWAFLLNAASFIAFVGCLLLAGPGQDAGRVSSGRDPREGSKISDGLRLAFRDWEIAVPLLMVAAVTVADDPVLVLGPSLAHHLGAAASWSGWFIAALGAGTVIGSFRPSRHNPSIRKAATALAILAVCMIVFIQSPSVWVSLTAAFGAGAGCLVANSTTKTLLTRRAGPACEASVMAVWAIAWAGSKPVASLSDGLLAGWFGLKTTGVLLAIPALIPFLVLIGLMIIVFAMRAPGRWLRWLRTRLSSRAWIRRAETYLADDTWNVAPAGVAPAGVAPAGVVSAGVVPAARPQQSPQLTPLVHTGAVQPPYLTACASELWTPSVPEQRLQAVG
jgi:predicted MFS family arabinose efflux permease